MTVDAVPGGSVTFLKFPVAKKPGQTSPVQNAFNQAVGSSPGANYCYVAVKKIYAFFLDPDKPAFINSVLGEARAVYSVVKAYFQVLIRFARVLGATQLTHAISMPFDVYSLVMRTVEFFITKDIRQKIDAAWGFLGDVASIGDGATNLLTGLVEMGQIAQAHFAWILPINTFSNMLSAIFFAINVRSIVFKSKVIKKLDNKLKQPNPDYHAAAKYIRNHQYELQSHCGVNYDLLIKKMAEVSQIRSISKAPDREAKYCASMKNIVSIVKTRTHNKIGSDAHGLLISTIGVLVTIVFTASAFSGPAAGPLAIAGAALLAVLYVNSLIKMGFGIYSNARFKHSIRHVQVV